MHTALSKDLECSLLILSSASQQTQVACGASLALYGGTLAFTTHRTYARLRLHIDKVGMG